MVSVNFKITSVKQGQEIKKWLRENIPKSRWEIVNWGNGKEIFFVRETDASWFALRWS